MSDPTFAQQLNIKCCVKIFWQMRSTNLRSGACYRYYSETLIRVLTDNGWGSKLSFGSCHLACRIIIKTIAAIIFDLLCTNFLFVAVVEHGLCISCKHAGAKLPPKVPPKLLARPRSLFFWPALLRWQGVATCRYACWDDVRRDALEIIPRGACRHITLDYVCKTYE